MPGADQFVRTDSVTFSVGGRRESGGRELFWEVLEELLGVSKQAPEEWQLPPRGERCRVPVPAREPACTPVRLRLEALGDRVLGDLEYTIDLLAEGGVGRQPLQKTVL